MEARAMSQQFMEDGLKHFMNPQNRYMNSLLIGPGLPGGMMGSLMADLENNLKSLNKWMTKNNKPLVTQGELLIKLFNEVEFAWPQLGYPPLVTPFSQYVKNVSLMNAINQYKGKPRWSMIDENTWGMILGRSGKLPGPLGEKILQMAKEQKREFYNDVPQDLYPDELELFAEKMVAKGWDFGQDDEELMEYAMHPQQYEDFKSGVAKEKFQKTLADKISASNTSSAPAQNAVLPISNPSTPRGPQSYTVEIDGEKFSVQVAYNQNALDSSNQLTPGVNNTAKSNGQSNGQNNGQHYEKITAPLEGKFYLTKDNNEIAKKIGDKVNKGDTVAYIESMKVINAITADKSGVIQEVVARHGEDIEEDDVIFKLS